MQFLRPALIRFFPILLLFSSPLAVAEPLAVFVSVLPQAYLTTAIGGEHVTVHTLISASQDPHTYEPSPQQVLQLAKARIYFTIGIPFEQALTAKIPRDGRTMIVTTGSQDGASEPAKGHAHPENGHGDDPHVWLAPPRIREICGRMVKALITADPEHGAVYEDNARAFIAKLDQLDQEIGRRLLPFKGRVIYVYHPAFGHFTSTYGIKQRALEFEGKTPSAKALAAIVHEARADQARTIFVQPQFDRKNAQILAQAIGAELTEMNDLEGDILANLQDMAVKIEKALAR